jgi:hypothetical protein
MKHTSCNSRILMLLYLHKFCPKIAQLFVRTSLLFISSEKTAILTLALVQYQNLVISPFMHSNSYLMNYLITIKAQCFLFFLFLQIFHLVKIKLNSSQYKIVLKSFLFNSQDVINFWWNLLYHIIFAYTLHSADLGCKNPGLECMCIRLPKLVQV